MKKGGKGKSSREKESQGANIVNTPDELDTEGESLAPARLCNVLMDFGM